MAGKLRRKNRLTQERLREVLNYDPMTGIFTNRVSRSPKARAGEIAGGIGPDGYVHVCIDRECHRGHRLAWFYVHGVWPDPECDHRNTIRSDNRIDNLRVATVAEQRQNQSLRSDNKTGFKGVAYMTHKGRYRARIVVAGVVHVLGQGFLTAEEAHAAYLAAKARLHTFQPTVPAPAKTG